MANSYSEVDSKHNSKQNGQTTPLDDVIISGEVIYVAPAPFAIQSVNFEATAMFTMKLHVFVKYICIYITLKVSVRRT